jgi:CcmD family protein
MANELVPVYVAYSLVWVGLFLYLFYIDRKERALSNELNELKQRYKQDGK